MLIYKVSPPREIPFVRDNRPDLSRVPEKGIRPAGTFFDHFADEDEKVQNG
jgi:hypothetical protein